MTTKVNAFFRRGIPTFAAALLLCGLAISGASAQTSSGVCAQDSLFLVSPEGLNAKLVSSPVFGVELSWDELPDAVSSCAVPVDTAGLDFRFILEGQYAGIFDRTLRFDSVNGGQIGSPTQDRVVFGWSNPQTYTGDINGEINLSNSGGIYHFSALEDSWTQVNTGLPVNLPYTDLKSASASAQTPGMVVAQLSSREFVRGIWMYDPDAGRWSRLAQDEFPDGLWDDHGVNAVAVSPLNDDDIALGTQKRGVMISHDGGETFVEHSVDIASGSWSNRPVTALEWTPDGKLLAGIRNLGLYISTDSGDSYSQLENLVVPADYPDNTTFSIPVINRILALDGNHLLVAVNNFGVYESVNAGADWTWLTEGLLADEIGGLVSVVSMAEDPRDAAAFILGTTNKGLWRTGDYGSTWTRVGEDLLPVGTTPPSFKVLFFDPSISGVVYAMADGLGLFRSDDDGNSWSEIASAPAIVNSQFVAPVSDGSGDLLFATYGGGIYVPGTMVPLSATIVRNQTEEQYRDLDFGLEIGFEAGLIEPAEYFNLVVQDFQGYAVWRSNVNEPDDMQLIGLYDKNNPETCIEGYCGSGDFSIKPGCFAEKRSACFDFSDPAVVKFFDADVYDGFVYNYAVTTFDYGNTSWVSESGSNQINDQLYSPRFNDDPISLFNLVDVPGDPTTVDGNRILYSVNIEAQDPLMGPEIYVVPNPLREGVGFPEMNGEMVEFRNLPPESRIKVFTVDGDLVADLGPELQEGHNIKWVTRNPDDRLLASGVYIWRVEMPQREHVFGKLVIIR